MGLKGVYFVACCSYLILIGIVLGFLYMRHGSIQSMVENDNFRNSEFNPKSIEISTDYDQLLENLASYQFSKPNLVYI